MMAKRQKELTWTFHVGGKQVDELTPEQLDRMADRLSRAMSLYYSNHMDEYARITAGEKIYGKRK
jgi:hypothetical protein